MITFSPSLLTLCPILSHPHIVNIYCTYEKKSRYYLILQPLATCDLEAFLEQNDGSYCDGVSKHDLIWKWFRCLANTLSFIHEKGIRHKDIKTRNILVKGHDVIFADFGSSHAFADEGTSLTTGPAFGHTRLYCAPEVITEIQRRRSADVFSLGCVFSELATVLDGRVVSDYFEFRTKTTEEGEMHAYHATLDRTQEWFDLATPEVKSIFAAFIASMLSVSPTTRPTAQTVSAAVEICFKAVYGRDLPVCQKCDSVNKTDDVSSSISQLDIST